MINLTEIQQTTSQGKKLLNVRILLIKPIITSIILARCIELIVETWTFLTKLHYALLNVLL